MIHQGGLHFRGRQLTKYVLFDPSKLLGYVPPIVWRFSQQQLPSPKA